jgi:hypothetical protein
MLNDDRLVHCLIPFCINLLCYRSISRAALQHTHSFRMSRTLSERIGRGKLEIRRNYWLRYLLCLISLDGRADAELAIDSTRLIIAIYRLT